MPLRVGDIIRVSDDRVGESVIDEVFDDDVAGRFKREHPLALRCNRFVARDPGDNLIVTAEGIYHYWDHESGDLIRLGVELAEFVIAHEE